MECDAPAHIEQAQLRIIRFGDGGVAVRRLRQRELHIGLARDEPNLANQHVFDLDRVRRGDGERLRLVAGAHRTQADAPPAVGSSRRFQRLPCEPDGNGFTRIRRAPDRHFGIALENHAVAEDVGHGHARLRGNREEDDCGDTRRQS